ncbi:MAG: Gfo/Idh/MocA family oxidoreductase [Armatimonadota bacterium]|jgi:predicted dehydrogenase
MQELGVAVIGLHHLHSTGWIQNVHDVPATRLVAIAERDAALLETVGRPHAAVHLDAEWRATVERSEVDLVIILLPHDEMPRAAVAAAEMGKHLIIEKPGAVHAPAFDVVLEAVERTGVRATAPYLWRYDPVVLQASTMIAEGSLGRPLYGTGRFNAGGPERYMELSPWMLKQGRSGGGPLLNLGVHLIDVLWLLFESEPTHVYCQLSRAAHELEIEDHARVLLEFAAGQQGLVETSYVLPPSYPPTGYDSALTIKGTEGYISWEQRDNIMVFCAADGTCEQAPLERTAGGWTDASGYGGENGLEFLADFADAIHKGGRPRIGLQDAARLLRVVDAAHASAESGRLEVVAGGARAGSR